MGKRSDFKRRKNDNYETPESAVLPLIPHLQGVRYYVEPCAGNGMLTSYLYRQGLIFSFAGDIDPQPQMYGNTDFSVVEKRDAMTLKKHEFGVADAIITNPPWTRVILHPMILHFQSLLPTWLLFDADWMHTKQARPFLDQCSHIVSVGRVKWIKGSKHTGKDNCGVR